MGEQAQSSGGLRQVAGQLRRDVSQEKVDERLEGLLSKQPLARHALLLPVVGRAVLVAAVAAGLFALLFSPKIAAVVLVLGFVLAWAVFASRSYQRRRRTVAAEGDE